MAGFALAAGGLTEMSRVTRAEFAEICGVSRAAITKLTNSGRIWVESDGKIDTESHGAVEYRAKLSERRGRGGFEPLQYRSKGNLGGKLPRKKKKAPGVIPDEGDAHGQESSGDEDGGGGPFPYDDPEYQSRLDRRSYELEKVKHQALRLRLQNAITIGTVVLREEVERAVMGPINTAFVRLLTDCAKTIAAQVRPMALGGATVEEIEVYIRGQHSTVLKNLKNQMQKALKKKNDAE